MTKRLSWCKWRISTLTTIYGNNNDNVNEDVDKSLRKVRCPSRRSRPKNPPMPRKPRPDYAHLHAIAYILKLPEQPELFSPLWNHDDVVFTLEIEEEEAGNEEKSLIIVRNVGNGRVLAYLKKINFNLEDAPFSSSSEYSNRKCMKSWLVFQETWAKVELTWSVH